MRRRLLSGCFPFLVLLTLACQRDDDFEPAGTFSLEGNTHVLNKGYFASRDQYIFGTTRYDEWSIIMTSDGVNLDLANVDFTGSGDFVLLLLVATNRPGDFPEGQYSVTGGSAGLFISYGGVFLNYDVDAQKGTSYERLSEGTFSMKKSGDLYAISFSLSVNRGRQVKGTYVGRLVDASR